MTPHPTHIEAVADAAASSMSGANMTESSKFQAWQSIDCAWCDNKAKGNALYVYDGHWFASCGKHGRKFEPFEEPK